MMTQRPFGPRGPLDLSDRYSLRTQDVASTELAGSVEDDLWWFYADTRAYVTASAEYLDGLRVGLFMGAKLAIRREKKDRPTVATTNMGEEYEYSLAATTQMDEEYEYSLDKRGAAGL